MNLPSAVRQIISRLEASGYPAYAVGGCVRDSLMGKLPHDWDICTAALPEEILEALETHSIIESGLKHGTVTVKVDGYLYEITTFRTDGDYKDRRHPESVTFVRSLNEDLARRDFTINAMAYWDEDGLTDLYGGQEDLQQQIIRCVGDPHARFGEDALRILRALRFASRLGFAIEPQTNQAIHDLKDSLSNISAERLCSELLQILDGDAVETVLLEYSDVLAVFLPELLPMIGFEQHSPHHCYDVWEHTVKVVAASPKGKIPRLAALFHDIGKPRCFTMDERGRGHFHGHPAISAEMTEKILRRLKLDHKTAQAVVRLIEYHDTRPEPDAKHVRRFLSKLGPDYYDLLRTLKIADVKGQNPSTAPEKLRYIQSVTDIVLKETSGRSAFRVSELAVGGKDLMTLGVPEGKSMGQLLQKLLQMVIDGEVENEHACLMQAAAACLAQGSSNGTDRK